MVDHVEHRAGGRLGGEGEDAQRDEAEVRDRGVGHQPLHVALPHRQQRRVEDADHGQDEHERCEVARRVGEQRQAVAQEAEGAHLVEDADEQHGATDRRLRRGVGQPGVQRDQRRLDGEGDEEAQEQQLLHAGVDLQLAERVEGEGALAQLAGAHHVQADDGGEHDQPADQAVEEELHRGVLPARPAEPPDQEVHRDEHRLEEDVEEEHVGGGEDADHERLEQQQPGEEVAHGAPLGRCCRDAVGPGCAVLPRGADDQRHQQADEQQHHQRDAVDAEGELHAEVGDPGHRRRQLEPLATGVERDGGQDGEHQDDQADAEGQLPREQLAALRQRRDHRRAHGGHGDHRHEEREITHGWPRKLGSAHSRPGSPFIDRLPLIPTSPPGAPRPPARRRRACPGRRCARTRSGCGPAATTSRRARRPGR